MSGEKHNLVIRADKLTKSVRIMLIGAGMLVCALLFVIPWIASVAMYIHSDKSIGQLAIFSFVIRLGVVLK